ncbi:DUF1588 domain-containing protein [Calycomorphotria hydatis]|uniref:Planctomycete cytochrome C n=1 Tax=Calycomorphotria hydatis TaxID=2528027 RepID=A0A517T4E8_9PLAN|nr:DUF1588 domain-containing protein [Calycomorphotria hydatis]QDT63248.1 Planctomycete cytochrome C [Calycomorphotria hydatis]
MIKNFILTIAACAVVNFSFALADEQAAELSIQSFLETSCLDCHGADTQEGGVAFHQLENVNADNAELWKQIWEQVALKEMPPADSGYEVEPLERLRVSQWITGELEEAMKGHGGFHSHQYPAKGNHLDHDLLFGSIPEGLEPPSTPARIWRIHPQEHLTRLNQLINNEPAYDPERPGLRTIGDHIPATRDGEVKVFFGLDRVIGWVGGSAAYAAAISGFPPMLSQDDHHGLRNYANMYSVNGAEATQIARTAGTVLRFMAFGPDAKPFQFADNVREIDRQYKHESFRGLSQSLFYGKTPVRPVTPIQEFMHAEGVSDELLRDSVEYLFEALTCRPPTDDERTEYVEITQKAINDLGKEQGTILGLTAIFLDRDALFRTELAETGSPDQYGRVMLQGQELALAINAAFSYLPPDDALKQALEDGLLKTREDVEREVTRILEDDSIRKPRILQFFREYFDYDRAGKICKDSKAMAAAGGNSRTYYRSMFGMTANTDRLVELILQEDKQVLRELLTTDRVVFDKRYDADYFGEFVGKKAAAAKRAAAEKEEKEKPKNARNKGPSLLIDIATLPEGKPIHVRIAQAEEVGKHEGGEVSTRQLTHLPAEQRMGILTHPSWLVSHSDAMDNHAIVRGRWVRERLLGDAVPDVPITVDAMLPDEPKSTLRHRMRVTREEYCWKCHKKMDPLGLPFEMYNHLGLYRTEELEQPVDTTGEIINSGDPALDGPVENAIDMIDRLANSERVEQVFVRHAFRFWMGRNETLNDAPVLQAAHQAYRESDGSMKALLKSLLTSDAFLYRKVSGEERQLRASVSIP